MSEDLDVRMQAQLPLYEAIFARNIGLFTPQVQELLRTSSIAVAGVGGPGGASVEALARMGCGKLKLADFDVFEPHNLNRQIGGTLSTLGKTKIDVVAQRVHDINPHSQLELFAEGITVENAADFVADADLIIDTVDYYAPEARLAVHKQARAQGKYVISTPAPGFGALVMTFAPEGMSMKELFGFPDDPQAIREHQMDVNMLLGCKLGYLSDAFFATFDQEQPYASTNGAAVLIAGGATALQALKILMKQAQEKDPEAFKTYGPLELITAPHAFRIDGWDPQYCRIVNVLEREDITEQQVWIDIADAYEGFIVRTSFYEAMMNELQQQIGDSPLVRVDGCGVGYLVNKLLEDPNRTVVACDANKHMLELARTKVIGVDKLDRVTLTQADATTYQQDALVDAVVASNLLFNLPDGHAYLANAYAGLKPGGKLVLTSAKHNPDPDLLTDAGIADLRHRGLLTAQVLAHANIVRAVNKRFMGVEDKEEQQFSTYSKAEIAALVEEVGFTVLYNGDTYLNQSFLIVGQK